MVQLTTTAVAIAVSGALGLGVTGFGATRLDATGSEPPPTPVDDSAASPEGDAAAVTVDGWVHAVTPTGEVLVTGDDEMCLHGLDGATHECFTVSIPPQEPVAVSPDGTRVAFGHMVEFRRRFDAPPGVSILDLRTGEVEVVGAEVTGDGVSLFPVWVGDDELRFLHYDVDGRDSAYLRVAADGAAEAVPIDLDAIVAFDLAPLGDGLVTIRSDGQRVVTLIAADGSTEPLGKPGWFDSLVGTSAGDVVVASGFDVETFRPVPVVLFRADSTEPIPLGRDGYAATLDPDGELVAAVSPAASDGDGLELVLWDPASGSTAVLGVGERPPLSLAWTLDDEVVLVDTDAWQVVDVAALRAELS